MEDFWRLCFGVKFVFSVFSRNPQRKSQVEDGVEAAAAASVGEMMTKEEMVVDSVASEVSVEDVAVVEVAVEAVEEVEVVDEIRRAEVVGAKEEEIVKVVIFYSIISISCHE